MVDVPSPAPAPVLPLPPTPPDIGTLGELRASGWRSRSVKDEVRANVVRRLRDERPLIEGVVGYDDTVLPQLTNALLAGHDVIMLGERGQAKTRIIRGLVELLDEWMPVVAGSEVNDDPYAPISAYGRGIVADEGDDTHISWVHRADRYGEKLATPDTSIADLIGEVDPIKVAEGRYLSDELTLHYGLVPRTNRGVFAINELPDLAERIQVGLLNVLEERDVQIRGHRVRLPLDVMLVASANPEDYTSRGRLITPLKDRFGAQVRTHYPLEVGTEVAIVRQEAAVPEFADVTVLVPDAMAEIVATVSHMARTSPDISQHSGVSVRLTVANHETMVANAVRRALRLGEEIAAPRVCDLASLPASTMGKVEFDTLDDGREGEILERLVDASVLKVFRDAVPGTELGRVVDEIGRHPGVEVGDEVPLAWYEGLLADLPATTAVVSGLAGPGATGAEVASAFELLLEGLHLSRRLNKDAVEGAEGPRHRYTSRA